MRERMTMVLKGLRFGMLLQLAVGPVCLLTFRSAADHGFLPGLQVALAAVLVDALFVALSGAGAAALLRGEKIKAAMRWLGCLVLVIFGADTMLSALNIRVLPSVSLFSSASGGSLFWQGVLLTASNPLTIVFWSGMFTAQMAKNQWNRRQLGFFAMGCVLSTLLSLAAVAALGSILSSFLPVAVITVLNAAVGAVLIGFGLKMLLQKEETAAKV